MSFYNKDHLSVLLEALVEFQTNCRKKYSEDVGILEFAVSEVAHFSYLGPDHWRIIHLKKRIPELEEEVKASEQKLGIIDRLTIDFQKQFEYENKRCQH